MAHAGGGARLECVRPYRNSFSGRDTTPNSFHCHHDDARWNLHVTSPSGEEEEEMGVIGLVERMIKDGWEKTKTLTIREKGMATAKRIEELTIEGPDGFLVPLDLSAPDERHNDMDEDWPSEPPKFPIMSIAQLQQWDKDGRPLPTLSHNAGNEVCHKHRDIKHPDDPLGLVADKLGRAIANERHDKETGARLEPVFIHVYSLGHASVMKMMDKGMEAIGIGAFHAAIECYGMEWSYGYNDEGTGPDGTGVFYGPPKYCSMHEYKETHYIGDTTLSISEFDNWLQLLRKIEYKKEDPLDPAFPTRAPNPGETPAHFYGDKNHPVHRDQLMPLTAKAADEKNEQFWITFKANNGSNVTARVGWWGDEYALLSNNCCFFVDHVLKITTKKHLPHWVFSLAKMGQTLEKGMHFVHDSAFAAAGEVMHGVKILEHLLDRESGAGASKGKDGGGKGCCCCGGRPGAKREDTPSPPQPAP